MVILNQIVSLKTKSSNNLNIAILRSSIDDINNTIDAWNDNGDGIIDVNEIDYNQIDKIRGLQVTITTTAKNDTEAIRLLELYGMPFIKETVEA